MIAIKIKKIPCEIYSRVCGYLRPIDQWNFGKKREFRNRQDALKKGDKNYEKVFNKR